MDKDILALRDSQQPTSEVLEWSELAWPSDFSGPTGW